MTDPEPAAASIPRPPRPRRRGRRTVGFLTVCLLVFLLVAGWLYVLVPVSAPPG